MGGGGGGAGSERTYSSILRRANHPRKVPDAQLQEVVSNGLGHASTGEEAEFEALEQLDAFFFLREYLAKGFTRQRSSPIRSGFSS